MDGCYDQPMHVASAAACVHTDAVLKLCPEDELDDVLLTISR
jgi:hypothetical protein